MYMSAHLFSCTAKNVLFSICIGNQSAKALQGLGRYIRMCKVVFYLLISAYYRNWMKFIFEGVVLFLLCFTARSLILRGELTSIMFMLNKVNTHHFQWLVACFI